MLQIEYKIKQAGWRCNVLGSEFCVGLTLHYRSKRRGFVYYTMGQIREVARHFYHKELQIELVREEVLFDTVHVTFQLTFDNRAFTLASLAMTREEKHLPIGACVLFEIFPFCIVFGYVPMIATVQC